MTTSPPSNEAARPKLAIGFDADDTLWRNEDCYLRAAEKFKSLLRGQADPVLVERTLAETEIRNIRWYGYGFKSYTLSMIESAIAVTDGRLSRDSLLSILALGREMLDSDVVLFEHARSSLADLAASHVLILITKGDLFEQDAKLQKSGLAPVFRHVEIVPEKDPHNYLNVLQKLAISPANFLMVGNSLKSDIIPVLQIGGRAVFIPYENTWSHERADPGEHAYFQIEHLGKLPELVAALEASAGHRGT